MRSEAQRIGVLVLFRSPYRGLSAELDLDRSDHALGQHARAKMQRVCELSLSVTGDLPRLTAKAAVLDGALKRTNG